MSKPSKQSPVAGKPGPKVAGNKRAKQRKEAGRTEGPLFQPNAAGIDIGAREIYIAVPADRDDNPVRKCAT